MGKVESGRQTTTALGIKQRRHGEDDVVFGGGHSTFIYLEEPISSGYPAQPGLIGESVRPSVCPIRLRLCSTNIVVDATAPQM
jgi:hypothetical protein